ncbi:YebC/PmpR family DNA-binding transcriptional regulator [Psychrosphaera sp. B3R10]|uniref:Probable transcriptional regulatory protein PN838_24830 n=1 Tax=Psychrosphaera algicola TaxID=3023714 RepID=A0ABT5FJN6_9GAMM|nr:MULTISPECIES: YebC/PmpR family DNA-binding transcriptional regulator [unclassified Psychrosphaera]MBU2883221.1 YebC/PmpR family DNA-binding transcriptional regulator [Psychrosphaera sp. I2R16]MBU2989160.1 YebC/PmpR family DNA-binding transcriptional regulator [Psychrosphaera sp. B3R10]MDC2891370.1 YebC/PmpR family DNA-binding transcriptional regulator [Psychrosphaera sp. G1-22]MDO6720470.1 YebC/PmpR family DNA-binding transcriptional regulator [Psychrosphaera sp. 1_MG-2023]
MGRAFQNRKDSMAKTAAMKTKIYSKYGKEIYVVAKNGGSDPDGNLALRSLMDRAKKDQVPAHVIKNALDKALGGAGEDYSAARYEGFGPGGCMVIVDCLTDNNNRTIMEVRNSFTKTNSKLGAQGSAAHMFDHVAIFQFDGDDEDVVLEALMNADADANEIEVEDGKVTVIAPHTEFNKVKVALEEAFEGIDFDTQEISWEPQTMTTVSGDDVAVFDKFMDMLNDCEDVQDVYHNAEVER